MVQSSGNSRISASALRSLEGLGLGASDINHSAISTQVLYSVHRRITLKLCNWFGEKNQVDLLLK